MSKVGGSIEPVDESLANRPFGQHFKAKIGLAFEFYEFEFTILLYSNSKIIIYTL